MKKNQSILPPLSNIMEEMELYNKDHLKETLNIRGIQRKIGKNSLKLNTSNGKLGGAW